jgi:hypothetical protein
MDVYARMDAPLPRVLGIVCAGMSGSFLLTSVLSIFGIVALVSWLLMALFGGWQGSMLDERKDYAVERILLRKVGGGYLFIHRLILDYFASLPQAEKDGEKPSD